MNTRPLKDNDNNLFVNRESMRKSTPSALPMRKQLAKKLLNYFDELKTKTDAEMEARGHKHSHSRHSRHSRSPRRKEFMDEPTKLLSYHDDIHTKLKLLKVKALMEEEIKKSEMDGALEYEDPEFNKTRFVGKNVSKDMSRENSVENKPVEEILKERVEEVDNLSDFISADEVEEEELGGTKDRLFHLDLEHIDIYKDSKDRNLFDHHQRKSKEIRRIQYWAELDRGGKKPQKKKTKYMEDIKILEEEPRSNPKQRFPVWVLYQGQMYPAFITSPNGFLLNPTGSNIEIREADKVFITPRDKSGFPSMQGTVKRSLPMDKDADFAVVDNKTGRYPVYIREKNPSEPPKTDENCNVLDHKGNKVGRARVDILRDDGSEFNNPPYFKGVLLEGDNTLTVVLVKPDKKDRSLLSYKVPSGEHYPGVVAKSERIPVSNHSLTRLTLYPPEGSSLNSFPPQIYLLGPPRPVEAHPLFEGERARATDHTGEKIEGIVKIDHPDILIIDDDNRAVRLRPDSSKDSKKGHPVENAVWDDGLWKDIREAIQDETRRRSSASNQDNNDHQNSEPEVNNFDDGSRNTSQFSPEPSNIHKSEVEKQQNRQSIKQLVMLPHAEAEKIEVHSPKREILKQKKSEPTLTFKPAEQDPSQSWTLTKPKNDGKKKEPSPIDRSPEPARPENTPQNKKDDGSANTKRDNAPTTDHTPNANQTPQRFLTTTKTDNDARPPSRLFKGVVSNLKVRIEVPRENTPFEVCSEGQLHYARDWDKIIDFEGIVFRQDRPSNQAKILKERAVNDIKVYWRYYKNKLRYRRDDSEYLDYIRKQFNNSRKFKQFINYYLGLPETVPVMEAYTSYKDLTESKRKLHY
jgi:hypothetical protein